MSSSLARSACGKAGSSFSSRCCPSPWPGSSVGLTGEFSLDELGDDVWNDMKHLKKTASGMDQTVKSNFCLYNFILYFS